LQKTEDLNTTLVSTAMVQLVSEATKRDISILNSKTAWC